MKYTGKALDKIWGVLQEIEEARQIGGDDTRIKLPYYPVGTNADDNALFETRKSVLEMLHSHEAIGEPKKIRTKRRNEDYFYWAFAIGKDYQTVLADFKKQQEQIKEGGSKKLRCGCGQIKVNLDEATLQINDSPPVDISPQHQGIRLLTLLIKARQLVTYDEIAKNIDSTSFKSEVLSRGVNFIKKEVRKIMLKAGMSPSEFKKTFITVRNTGYIINCFKPRQ